MLANGTPAVSLNGADGKGRLNSAIVDGAPLTDYPDGNGTDRLQIGVGASSNGSVRFVGPDGALLKALP